MRNVIVWAIVFTMIGACVDGSHAAEQSGLDRGQWLTIQDETRTGFLAGYNTALANLVAAGTLAGQDRNSMETVIYGLWPQGHDLGQLGDSLMKECKLAENQKRQVGAVIFKISMQRKKELSK